MCLAAHDWKFRGGTPVSVKLLLPPRQSRGASHCWLVSDADGRRSGQTVSPEVDAVTHETELFCKALGEHLNKARLKHRYDKLFLVAPPNFLGLIRKKLDKEAHKLVKKEFAKDLSWFAANDIGQYVREHRWE